MFFENIIKSYGGVCDGELIWLRITILLPTILVISPINVGAVLNTVLESASNYNPNPKKCCNSNSRYQESINEDRFWCYEAENGYGIDFCAYEKCTTTIKNIDFSGQ